MQPFDALITPIVARVNRTLRETTPARELARELDGRKLAVRVRDSALAICIAVADGNLQSSTDVPESPDVIIEGPVSGLLRLFLAGSDISSLANTGVTLTGHADVAQKFQRLLKLARPDPEEELAGFVGDAAAHQIGETVRGLAEWGRRSGGIMAANVREYLQEERRDIPSVYEMSHFKRDVQTLRDDVERAEARLKRIEAARS